MIREIRYPENFISNIQLLETSLERTVSSSNRSAAEVQAIKALIERADRAYRTRVFRKAIQLFKQARSRLYKLLTPTHSGDAYALRDELMLPTGKVLEAKLAEASLQLIEDIRLDSPPIDPPVWVTEPPVDPMALKFGSMGYTTSTFVGVQIEERVEFGTTLIAQGQPQRAISVLEDVISKSKPKTPAERLLIATANLNLATAYIAIDDFDQADKTGSQAAKLFKVEKDIIGQAQAIHNIGIAKNKSGQTPEAKRLFAQSSKLISDASNPTRAQPAPTRTPVSTRTTARSSVASPRLRPRPAVRTPELSVTSSSVEPGAARGLGVAPESSRPSFVGSEAVSANFIRSARPSEDLTTLNFIMKKDTKKSSIRWVGDKAEWSALTLDKIKIPVGRQQTWQVGVLSGNEVVSLKWVNGKAPTANTLLKSIYKRRVSGRSIKDLRWQLDTEVATSAYLTHLYSFVIPQALGDCFHNLGNYQRAETYYLQAAEYSYINKALEAPTLWRKIADNITQWGDRFYKEEHIEEAKAVYSKLLKSDGGAPSTEPLFSLGAFSVVEVEARKAISALNDVDRHALNPAIASPIFLVWARWRYLNAGLDFFGLALSPIFTFEYLQQAARSFTQQSIQAERDFINFTAQAESETAARRDLENALTMAEGEIEIHRENLRAAADDKSALDQAVNLAQLRAQNARQDRDRYRSDGYWQYVAQSIATAHGAGSDWYGSEIRGLARNMENGSWSGESGKLAAAATLLAGQKSYEYQLARMQNQIEEMDATIPIAQAQAAAAAHRQEAARLTMQAAEMRKDLMEDALTAFDNEMFTPEIWANMAIAMREISLSYQHWAVNAGKLMERAYNFETAADLHIIKSDYGLAAAHDLLGSDYLLRDIDSFTYHYMKHTLTKESQLKDVISLRNEYSFQFYEFQQSGKLEFETYLNDFDRRHPGFYGQRLQRIEVSVIGLLPPEGIRGSMRGGFSSRFRQADGSERSRFHNVDTLALSEFTERNDGFVFRSDLRELGLFEGNGVASTWELELPRRSNNVDYRLITDVQVVFYYAARYDDQLKNKILTSVPLDGELIHVRDFALRYDFPESWYSLLKDRVMTIAVTPDLLPRNETAFITDKVGMQLIAAEGTSVEGVDITITLPDQTSVTMTTDVSGSISAESGNELMDIMGGSLLGEWVLQITPPAGSPLLKEDGSLDAKRLKNIAVIAQYGFTYP